MNYIVSSRGQPVGTTDLGFYVASPRHRIGWLHTNAHGEKVLPVVATVLPALRACVHAAGDDTEPSPVEPHSERATLLADLAAAMQHVEALELTLHREDGSLIPTENVGVKDMDQLLELVRSGELDAEFDEAEIDDEVNPPVEVEALDGIGAPILDDEDIRPWTPADDEESEFPRYQVHVMLREDHPLS